MNYFVAALVVSIMTTVRAELKRTTFTSKSILIQSSLHWALGYFSRDLTLRRLMSYIYGAPILDVSRSHTTTQHSR